MTTKYSTFDVAEVQRQRLAALEASLRSNDSELREEKQREESNSSSARLKSSLVFYCQMAFFRMANACLPCFELLTLFTNSDQVDEIDVTEHHGAKSTQNVVQGTSISHSDQTLLLDDAKSGPNKRSGPDPKGQRAMGSKRSPCTPKRSLQLIQERRTRSTSSLLHNKKRLRHPRPDPESSMSEVSERRESSSELTPSTKMSSSTSVLATRELRESSALSRSSLDTTLTAFESEESNHNVMKAGSLTSLGSCRSESMASVYSADGGRFGTVSVRGEVELGFLYSTNSQSLEVAVRQCRDLAAVDVKRHRSDPYVKIYLLPDKSKTGKRKTKVKKHTLNPVFDEILRFQMPLSEAERRVLWLSVWHSDMFGRNDFLGEISIALANEMLDDPAPKWYALHEHMEENVGMATTSLLSSSSSSLSSSSRGELVLALKFVTPPSESATTRRNLKTKGMLMVLVKEAKHLVANKTAHLDPFCKCYLLPEKSKSHKQKTNVCRRTTNPKWEHTVTWESVSLADLADRSLEIAVWDHDRLGHNELLGGARFNLGNGKHQGKPSMWMDATGREVTLWQHMLEKANFWVEGSVAIRSPDKMRTALPVL